MGCNTSDILGTAYRNGYAKLSARDLKVAAIAAACSTCNAQPLIEGAIGNGYLKLSEFDTAMCIANALCSSPGATGAPAPIALSAAIQNHLTALSRRDLDAVITAVLCKQTNPPCVTPSAPINPTAKVVTNTTIFVTWNQIANSGSLITGYTVKWGTVSGVYTNSAVVPAIPKNYLITGLTAGTQYFFVVQANSAAAVGCSSANSSEANATTTGAAPGNGLLNGLISYWKFDNVSALNTPDSVGANTLTLSFANSGTAGGIINGDLDIGAGASYATHADNTDFSPVANTSIAFSGWFSASNWNSGGQTIMLLNKSDGAANGQYQLYIDPGTNKLAWAVWDTGGNVTGGFLTPGVPVAGFHHVVCGFDSPTKAVYAYYDGVFQFSNSLVTNSVQVKALDFRIGTWPPNGLPALPTMRADECAMWHRTLTATDDTNLFNGGAGLPLSSFTP